MKKTVKYGILAVSSMSPRFVNAAGISANSEVLAIASRSLEKAEDFRQQYNIPKAYGGYKELLKDPEIDAVYIPTVNAAHFPYALDSLKAGKHVILEKPFVIKTEEAQLLQKTAEEKGLFIAEAVKSLYLPIYKDILKTINDGTIGQMVYLEFRQSHVNSPYSQGWNRDKSLGAGSLWGHGSYFISMAELFAGPITKLTGSAQYDNGVDVQFAVSAVTESGIPAVCLLSKRTRFPFNGLIIHGEKGRIVIPNYWRADKAEVYVNNELINTIEYPCQYELVYEIDHFSDCILKGLTDTSVLPLKDIIRHVRLIEELYDEWESR